MLNSLTKLQKKCGNSRSLPLNKKKAIPRPNKKNRENQKLTLKEFINVIDSTSTLKDFYNTKIIEIKEVLLNLNEKVTDKATQIKINEVNNLISEVDKSTKINDDHLVNLLQYYSLIEELKKSNGK